MKHNTLRAINKLFKNKNKKLRRRLLNNQIKDFTFKKLRDKNELILSKAYFVS